MTIPHKKHSDFKQLGPPVPEQDRDLRLDIYLAKRYPFLNRHGWQKRIKRNEVLLNKLDTKSAKLVQLGDTVWMYHPEEREPQVNENIEVLYKSATLAVINKPPGLPMHEGGPYRFHTVEKQIKEILGTDFYPAHRLDRETSGVVICGGNSETRETLGRYFRDQQVKKTYLALSNHKYTAESQKFLVDAPIGDLVNSKIRIKKWVNFKNGQEAQTDFEIISTNEKITFLKARPITGRTNQIRIHAAYKGLLLLGDKLYHPDEQIFLDHWENPEDASIASRCGHDRCCLHAYKVVFDHPTTKERLEIKAKMPEDFIEILNRSGICHSYS